MTVLRPLWAVLVPVLLLGCQSLPQTEDNPPWRLTDAANQTHLQAFDRWVLRGKIGITRDGVRETAAINQWRQDLSTFEIQLSSTVLGLGATTVSGDLDHLKVMRPGEPTLESDHPQSLLQDSLGWQVPLSALPHWVKGHPAPQSSHSWQVLPSQDAVILEQAGWQIRFERIETLSFAPDRPALLLPHRVVLTRAGQEVKLAISQWELL